MANEQHPENSPVEDLEDDHVTLESHKEAVQQKEGENPQSAADKDGGALDDAAEQIAQLQGELTQAKEQVLRAAAEVQNIRRRAEQDVEKAHKYGLEKFVNDMLPVADNLERSIDAAAQEGADMASIVEGVELTLKSLIDALKRHKVETVNPEGEPFDPQLHQAMSIVEQADVEPNTVINVFQKGYTLHGRLVRPAMVVVAKGSK